VVAAWDGNMISFVVSVRLFGFTARAKNTLDTLLLVIGVLCLGLFVRNSAFGVSLKNPYSYLPSKKKKKKKTANRKANT